MATRRPGVRRESATAARGQAIKAPPHGVAEILERCLELGVEKLAPRNDHEIDRAGRRESDLGSKHLSNQTFSSISLDGPADFPGGHDPQPRAIQRGLQQQEREETAVNPLAGIEDGAELPAFANPSLAGKSRRRAARPAGDVFHRRLYARLRAHRLHSLTVPGPVAARTSRPSRTCPAGPTRRKPSAACGPWRGDASGRDGHSSWPCAPGSREYGDGAGDSVETCVCPS